MDIYLSNNYVPSDHFHDDLYRDDLLDACRGNYNRIGPPDDRYTNLVVGISNLSSSTMFDFKLSSMLTVYSYV